MIAYYDLQSFIYTKNHFCQLFSRSKKVLFSALLSNVGQQVLPKRSTLVDQILASDKAMSQLSIDIFIASRNQF